MIMDMVFLPQASGTVTHSIMAISTLRFMDMRDGSVMRMHQVTTIVTSPQLRYIAAMFQPMMTDAPLPETSQMTFPAL